MKNKRWGITVMMGLFAAMAVFGQPAFSSTTEESAGAGLPLKRLALFSSGVGFFEHSGTAAGTASAPFTLTLPFNVNAVNDVLKSLAVNDPLSDSPSVRYASSDTLNQILRSLAVDLSGNPGIAEILGSQRGAEIEVSGSALALKGRIVGIEHRSAGEQSEPWLTLLTPQGIRPIAVREIVSFTFTDERVNSDLARALDLLQNQSDWETRNLVVTLPGEGSRDVSLSYVIPSPVWKVSYRLDLSGEEARLQGWAIVDNDSDTDWNNVELSLVTGRPVSFIQNLYAPYRTSRPVLPLAIAGIAESRSYDSGSGMTDMAAEKIMADEMMEMDAYPAMPAPSAAMSYARAAEVPAQGYGGSGIIETAAANVVGEHFEFTFRRPVSLERRQSAMLPLTESPITAEKILVLSGARLAAGGAINPSIGAELVNSSGMRLPAGPITVYDGGSYAGDALVDFFPEDEKRIISWAEDLSVTGSRTASSPQTITAVTVSGGVMTISRRQNYQTVYTVRNASTTQKNLVIEHPVTGGTTLAEPRGFDERTPELYRFRRELPANREFSFTVREERPLSEQIVLARLRPESFAAYIANQEIPANVRSALARAVELRRNIDQAAAVQQELEARRGRLIEEQERFRLNIEAAGNQSPQGLEYLKRLAALDADIDSANARIAAAQTDVQAANREYSAYIETLNLR